jgi:hypothetical protein
MDISLFQKIVQQHVRNVKPFPIDTQRDIMAVKPVHVKYGVPNNVNVSFPDMTVENQRVLLVVKSCKDLSSWNVPEEDVLEYPKSVILIVKS